MKIGIYIPGLGQSFQQESVLKYATRLMNEYRYNSTGTRYELKSEKIQFADHCESDVVSIVEKKGDTEEVLYKFYEFSYGKILTESFNSKNILLKNSQLFLMMVKKFPVLLKRLAMPGGFNRPFQTFYLFTIFFLLAGAILCMIPASIGVITQLVNGKEFTQLVPHYSWIMTLSKYTAINGQALKKILDSFVSITALLLLVVPGANIILIALATEFVCADGYLEFGAKRQRILGALDQLLEYIAENDRGARVDFHAYSFGSLIAIDYIFPFGMEPVHNVKELTDSLITIGTPVEFVKAYYPGYYTNRNYVMEDKIRWVNVYSVSDALASNFRKDATIGEAVYGIRDKGLIPQNRNYEVVPVKRVNFLNFISLYSVRAHGMYWDPSTDGQSCLQIVYEEVGRK